MRPFSDIIANQIIPKALSPGFFFFLVGDVVVVVVVVVDTADVCVRGGGGDEAGVCVCLCECMYVCIHTVRGVVCGLRNKMWKYS